MRIAFLGNGPFAVPALERLYGAGREIAIVVARPDLPQGKHQTLVSGPVKQAALRLGLPVVQPANANAADFLQSLAALHLDLMVVADFGQILSRECLATARLGGINIHGSLLPAYRGAAPVAWAILKGDAESGVSIIQMTSRLDAGAVIAQRALPIDRGWTAGDLEERLAMVGADLALQAVEQLQIGAAHPIEQDERRASKAPKLSKEAGAVDWSKPATDIYNHIRGMQPWPIAFSNLIRPNKPAIRVQILKAIDPQVDAMLQASAKSAPAGSIIVAGATLDVQTGAGILKIERIKPAGKSAMQVPTFCRGTLTRPGDQFQ